MKVLKFCTLYISSLALPAIGSESLSEDTYANDMEDLQRKMQSLTISCGEKEIGSDRCSSRQARKSCALAINKNTLLARKNLPPLPPKDRLGFGMHKSASSSNLLALSRIKSEVQQPRTARDNYIDNEFEEDYVSPEREEASSSCCSEISVSTDSEATGASTGKKRKLAKKESPSYGDSDHGSIHSKRAKRSHKKRKNRGQEGNDQECDNGNAMTPMRPRSKVPGQRRYKGDIRMSKSSDLPVLGLDLDRIDQMSQENFHRKGSQAFRLADCPRTARFEIGSDEDPEENRNKNFIRILKILMAKHFSNALPAFIQLTVNGYERKNCSLQELVDLALLDPDTFHYVTRDRRAPRESVAMYSYVNQAISGEDGIINRVKRNIIDEIIMWISLGDPELPDEFVERLDEIVTGIMAPVVRALRDVLVSIFQSSDLDADYVTCCGCKFKKLSPEAQQQIIAGVGGILRATIEKHLGEGFSEGVGNLISGITSVFTSGADNFAKGFAGRQMGEGQ